MDIGLKELFDEIAIVELASQENNEKIDMNETSEKKCNCSLSFIHFVFYVL